ncbi:MAG TPA: erythromycin esterase [Chloroflexi bacterium]|nr:erythromycin esterase [Chloroflexota bacterium]
MAEAELLNRIRAAVHPVTGTASELDRVMELVGDARVLLLGEATHGTAEFYRERAHITERLVREKGFTIVAVEADWPDAYRVNRYVRGAAESAGESLSDFERFPIWMWRNREVLDFIRRLRNYNDSQNDPARKAGFYGLDLYSLFSSMAAVIDFLEEIDPEAATAARYRYSCFDMYADEAQVYGYMVTAGLIEACEEQAVQQLLELRRNRAEYTRFVPEDEVFYAEQNALVAKNAEQYYRTMYRGGAASWNLRDRHMVETLQELLNYFGPDAKAVVWEHNSHIGDARATSMSDRGELNVGQLVRQRFGDQAVLIGFGTYTGTVTAASGWDAPPERKVVRPALPNSWELLFHQTGVPKFFLPLRDLADPQLANFVETRRLERAIGVLYLPETERISHYFSARLRPQFDGYLWFDRTEAVAPLEHFPEWEEVEEVPETYPFGL